MQLQPGAGTHASVSHFKLTLVISKLNSSTERLWHRGSLSGIGGELCLLIYWAPNLDIKITCLRRGSVNNAERRGRIR